MQVAVLGTGIMGTGMVGSLAREGHDVAVWNRTRARAEELAGDRVTVADDPQQAVSGAEVVVTMLFDAGAVHDVVRDLELPEGCVWVQSSTVGLEGTRQLADLAAERGLVLLDAPVLGTRQPAVDGTLVVLVSGEESAVSRAQPVFDAIGRLTITAGTAPGAATALKLVANAWIATVTAALGQSVALAEGLDVDPRLFLAAIEGGPVDMPYAHAKGETMMAGDYPTAFAVDGAIKDLGLIRAAADEAGVSSSLASAVLALYEATAASGRSGEDLAAVREAFRGD